MSSEEASITLSIKKRQLMEQLSSIQKDDPVMLELPSDPDELGTSAWEAEAHAKAEVLKAMILNSLEELNRAFERISTGTYGKCQKCHQQIESERLKAVPTAALCQGCAS